VEGAKEKDIGNKHIGSTNIGNKDIVNKDTGNTDIENTHIGNTFYRISKLVHIPQRERAENSRKCPC